MSDPIQQPIRDVHSEVASLRRRRPGFWESILWCLVFLATQIGGALVCMTVMLMAFAIQHNQPGKFVIDQLNGLTNATGEASPDGGRPPVPAEIGQALAYGMLAAQVASFVLILLVVPRYIGRDWKRQIGVRKPAYLHLALVLLVTPGFMILPAIVQDVFSQITGLNPSTSTDSLTQIFKHLPLPIVILSVGIGPGVVEELWCRGFLGRGLCARYGIVTGVILTSLLFALLHMDPSQLLVFTLMGAYLHFVYIASRSIWVQILLHLLNNSIAMLATMTGLVKQLNANPQGLSDLLCLASFSLVLFASVALWTGRAKLQSNPNNNNDGMNTSAWRPEYPGVSTPPREPASEIHVVNGRVSPVALILTLVSFAATISLLLR